VKNSIIFFSRAQQGIQESPEMMVERPDVMREILGE
jgi:hypothetical protein